MWDGKEGFLPLSPSVITSSQHSATHPSNNLTLAAARSLERLSSDPPSPDTRHSQISPLSSPGHRVQISSEVFNMMTISNERRTAVTATVRFIQGLVMKRK